MIRNIHYNIDGFAEAIMDIDEMWDAFLESASRHHIPEDVIQEQVKEAEALRQDLDLVPVDDDVLPF